MSLTEPSLSGRYHAVEPPELVPRQYLVHHGPVHNTRPEEVPLLQRARTVEIGVGMRVGTAAVVDRPGLRAVVIDADSAVRAHRKYTLQLQYHLASPRSSDSGSHTYMW